MKTAVISGATKGIGRALAEALWKEGYSVAVCARTEADLLEMKEAFGTGDGHREFLWKVTDVSKQADVFAFADAVAAQWKKVDVLVNNAGIFVPGAVLEEEEGVLEKMFHTNVSSAYHLTRRLMPALQKASGAHIFNMCSIASIQAYPNGGSYTISKSALLGFSRILREETKPMGIKVTTVIAGATWSDSWKGADFPEDRLMQPEDIVGPIMATLKLGASAVVEEILIRPQLGDL